MLFKKVFGMVVSASLLAGMCVLPVHGEEVLHKGGALREESREGFQPFTMAVSGALPASVDLSPMFPVPGDQGDQASCVAWAVGYASHSYQEKLDHKWDNINNKKHLFSPAYIYNQINEGHDGGAQISDAMDLLMNQGVCSLADMPYREYNYTTQPTPAQMDLAWPHRITGYQVIDYYDHDSMKQALSSGLPVVIGNVEMCWDLDKLSPSNPVYDTVGDSRGLHALCLVGYDDSKQAFKFINSWGTGWGINGYGYISYDLITRFECDGFVMTDYRENIMGNQTPVYVDLVYSESGIELSYGEVSGADSYEVSIDGKIADAASNFFLGNTSTPKKHNIQLRAVTGEKANNTDCYTSWISGISFELCLYGDVNLDGMINGADAQLISQYLTGKVELDRIQKKLADVNGDGKISSTDGGHIIQYEQGAIDSFDAGYMESFYVLDEWDNPSGISVYSYGDVNRDGVINSTDSNLITAYATGDVQLDKEQEILADVNGDGRISAIDAGHIVQYYSGYIDKFSAGMYAVFI